MVLGRTPVPDDLSARSKLYTGDASTALAVGFMEAICGKETVARQFGHRDPTGLRSLGQIGLGVLGLGAVGAGVVIGILALPTAIPLAIGGGLVGLFLDVVTLNPNFGFTQFGGFLGSLPTTLPIILGFALCTLCVGGVVAIH